MLRFICYSTTAGRAFLGLLIVPWVFLAACEVYDPPPEADIISPSDSKWYPDSTLKVLFSERILPETFSFAVWPTELNREGELDESLAPPLLSECQAPSTGSCPDSVTTCGAFTVCLNESRDQAEITWGDAFMGRLGQPHFLVVNRGLADLQGNQRLVDTRLEFIVSPKEVVADSLDIDLGSGLLTMEANLHDIYIGAYLRLILDVGFDTDNGDTWLLGTYARPMEGERATDEEGNGEGNDAALLDAVLDGTGWSVFILGTTASIGDGVYYLETVPMEIDVTIGGFLPVRLVDFRLEGSLIPGTGSQERAEFNGLMRASELYLGDGEDEALLCGVEDEDCSVSAHFVGVGLFPEEATEGLPRLCDEDPCGLLSTNGGSCALPDPWVPGPECL